MRKTAKFLIAGALLAASSAPLVAAAAVNVDVNIGLPGFSTYVAPQPTYYYPPAAYYTPAPRYYGHYYRDYRDHWDRRWDRNYRHDDRRRW
ncbi:MAG TPA: hypothetical protein VNM70_18475 [Burkholderiales bacterium]|jgi:hypothetical protein|nr:hypothetical protein [Burkholderiales bacterium]